MATKTNIAANAAASVLSIALALTPWLAPACSHTEGAALQMRCYWTSRAEFALTAAVFIWALGLWFITQAQARRVAGCGLILLNVLVWATPHSWVIGVCGNPYMACHTLTFWIELWAGLLAVVGVVTITVAQESKTGSAKPDPWETRQRRTEV